MKALSIRQPYAFAVVSGFKPVENRTWRTAFRGPVLIHAGKAEMTADVEDVLRQIAEQTGHCYAVIERGYRNHRGVGAIVGAATLTDCVTRHDSPWFYGPYGFVFERPVWSGAVPCRGALGFFNAPSGVRLHIPPYVDALSPSPPVGEGGRAAAG